MKQKQITIGNKTILVVDLPEQSRIFRVLKSYLQIILNDKIESIHIPDGHWQLLGSVSEDVAVKVVDKLNDVKGFIGATSDMRFIYTASSKEFALRSILQSNGILTVNPLGNKFCNLVKGKPSKQWQTAQSQLWVNPVLLKNKDDE